MINVIYCIKHAVHKNDISTDYYINYYSFILDLGGRNMMLKAGLRRGHISMED